jgi:kinesin family protein 11
MKSLINLPDNDLTCSLQNPSSSCINESIQNIKTIIRVRPFLKKEFVKYNSVNHHPIVITPLIKEENKITLSRDSQVYEASYDKVFSIFSKQNDIFNYTKVAFIQLLNGYNCTLFTYGQTGSGKTYTMFGADWTNFEKSDLNLIENMKKYDFVINPFSEENGIIIRALNYIFDDFNKNDKGNSTLYCSFLQIYNENIYDLLNVIDI